MCMGIPNDLSEAAIAERAKSMARDWLFAIKLQHSVLHAPRETDDEFHPFGGG